MFRRAALSIGARVLRTSATPGARLLSALAAARASALRSVVQPCTGSPSALRPHAQLQRLSGPRRGLFVRVETTPNEHSLKFFPTGRVVLENGNLEFGGMRDPNTQKSPLAKQLFAVEGVQSLLFSHDFVTVTKQPEYEWDILKPHLFAAIMDFFDSGAPVFTDELPVTDTTILPEDDEVVATIKELIETRIRPVFLRDGGNIIYRGFKDGYVYLQLTGACSSCSSSKSSLHNGVENMLLHYIPEVQGVREVKDELDQESEKQIAELEARLRRARAAESRPAEPSAATSAGSA